MAQPDTPPPHLCFSQFPLQDGGLLVVDPGLKEEAASSGGLTVTVNPHGELCAVQKASGVGLPPSEIMRCIRVAAKQVGRGFEGAGLGLQNVH